MSGFGIGLVFNTTSVSAMAQAPEGQEGLVGSQLGVADSLGFAAIGAVGGTMVSVADRGVMALGPALVVVFVLASSIALVGASIAPRVRVPRRSRLSSCRAGQHLLDREDGREDVAQPFDPVEHVAPQEPQLGVACGGLRRPRPR